jgi:hypothetical protein
MIFHHAMRGVSPHQETRLPVASRRYSIVKEQVWLLVRENSTRPEKKT